MTSHVKCPPPRQLGNTESLESLTHWKTTFRTYFKKDDSYKPLIRANATWNPSIQNYGQTDEIGGLERSAAEVKEDLVDLLSTLAGFLPHSYLTDKLVSNTYNWNDVWQTIYDHYGVSVTSETLLDFEDLYKETGETHRQFFERLLQHTRQHLAPANVKVEQISTGTTAETMSVSIMNLVAVQWLRKTDPSLIKIIRTEYSTELRDNVQLAALVPRIARNIDSLLSRYNTAAACNTVNTMEDDMVMDELAVNRVWDSGPKRNKFVKPKSRPVNNPRQTTSRGPFCPACYYLGQQLETAIHVKHLPIDCPRKRVAINMLKMEDSENFQDDGNTLNFEPLSPKFDHNYQDKTTSYVEKDSQHSNVESFTSFKNGGLQNNKSCQIEYMKNKYDPDTNSLLKNNGFSENLGVSDSIAPQLHPNGCNSVPSLQLAVFKLGCRRSEESQNPVRKKSSPVVSVTAQGRPALAILDEGSEINCLDEGFAIRSNIVFIPTTCKALAAGKSEMKLVGQTLEDVKLSLQETNKNIVWDLGKAVVVSNLGVDILIGEPGKADNKISTIPHKKLIEVMGHDNIKIRLPYFSKKTSSTFYTTCRSVQNLTLYPGESLSHQIPPEMRTNRYACITPKRTDLTPWIQPRTYKINDNGCVLMENNSDQIVIVKKNEHIADIRACDEIVKSSNDDPSSVRKLFDLHTDDISHLIQEKATYEGNENFLSQVTIDPDNQLTLSWKKKFEELCSDFADIINPRPGKYNGYYGRVDNSINFATVPPPTIRSHLPKYSHDMLKIMGDKMDKLENWGVLRKPEDLGIVPEFVLPSMLTPKTEKGEWRLVTDFTPLNIHIKKLEVVSPTIEEAKEKLARFRYHIQLDLSNYFYQGGMKVEDIQYLATPHPFKGLRVYTCEPQGLKNASEHAYERLARIYGDLCRDERMTRMADGLFILGQTTEELFANFQEVLHRARLSGLTFKPSKIVIAPVNTILFGWKKIGDGWRPTPHTISPLASASNPKTVKQMRSWLGSFKQLSNSIEGYAVLLAPLEQVVGNRSSADHITWNDALTEAFENAKKSLQNIKTIFIPKPSDKLHTYSDYSMAHGAVGGRMEIHRTDEHGKTIKLHGGDFSCRVSNHQKKWFACEGEALATKLVIEHFARYLRESKNPIIHHTDNMPVVQAWKRSKGGSYSSSARIAAFLSGISALDIEIIHTPGKDLQCSDFNSRHPNNCQEKRCQICKFAFELENLGDNTIPMVGSIMVTDIIQGKITMPFIQKPAWLKAQRSDPTHQKLCWLIDNSQIPDKKKTRGDNTRLKLLHNLYANGSLTKAPDGLITVLHTDSDGGTSRAISVPYAMYPGLIQALHLKLNHPSKNQLQKMCAKYFYAPGHTAIIDEISTNCTTCSRLRQLPTEIFSESTTQTSSFGSNFSADIIRREGQKILLIREKLSQFTLTALVPDETADSLRDGLFSKILELIPASGATVQVDNAPGFQTLATESNAPGSLLQKFHIKIELGRSLNINKNPIAENGIKEFHKECLRLQPAGGPLTLTDLVTVTKNMNERIRNRGFSAKEILLQRDQISNENRPISDQFLADKQYEKRIEKHPKVETNTHPLFQVGQNVMLKTGKTKLKGREMYKIMEIYKKNEEYWAKIQKHESQFRSKEYDVKLTEIILVQGQMEDEAQQNNRESDTEQDSNMDNDYETAESDLQRDIQQPIRRQPRKAAIMARRKIQDMVTDTQQTLLVKEPSSKPPSHAWDYDTFCLIAEQETNMIKNRSRPRTRKTLKDTFSVDEPMEDTSDDYIWDDSQEQYTLYQCTSQLPNHTSTPDSIDQSLTEMSSSDDEVFHNPQPLSRSSRFKRVVPIRKRRVKRRLIFTHSSDTDDSPEDLPTQPPQPTPHSPPKEGQDEDKSSPEDPHTPRRNPTQYPPHEEERTNYPTRIYTRSRAHNLSDPYWRPLQPEDVNLGPRVQYLDEPLQAIQDSIPINQHRGAARSTVYHQFHRHGIRQPRH